MIIQKKLITDQDGNIMFTALEDNEGLARLVYGARQTTKGWTKDRTKKLILSVPPYVYYKYVDELGAECWQDKTFLREFARLRPEFAI